MKLFLQPKSKKSREDIANLDIMQSRNILKLYRFIMLLVYKCSGYFFLSFECKLMLCL